jgi:hypothetical protein
MTRRLGTGMRIGAGLAAVVAAVSAAAAAVAAGGDADAPKAARPHRITDTGPLVIEIQATLTRRGDPLLIANVMPSVPRARWSICPPPGASCTPTGHHGILRPGRSAAGTVFRAAGTSRGHVFARRTARWRGRVHAVTRPALRGDARVGGTVAPVAARWRGGWPGDYGARRIEACRTADARHCVTLMSSMRGHPGPHRRVVVRPRYAGRYLFAFDQRFSRDTVFPAIGYYTPGAIPPLETGGTVVRSARGVRVSG